MSKVESIREAIINAVLCKYPTSTMDQLLETALSYAYEEGAKSKGNFFNPNTQAFEQGEITFNKWNDYGFEYPGFIY